MEILVFCIAAALTALPSFVNFMQQGVPAVFKYFAADAFYYLSIADHSRTAHFFTFDGIYPTNGFHPLWEFFLRAAFYFISDQAAQLKVTFSLCIVLVACGTGLLAVFFSRQTGSPLWALFGAVPGIYYWLFRPWGNHYGNPSSFINGMESGLSILFFGWFCMACLPVLLRTERLRPSAVLRSSLCLTIIVFCRLDDIFIFAPFLALLLWNTRKNRPNPGYHGTRTALAACMPPLILIGGYLFYNHLTTGMPLPSSGVIKAGFAYRENIHGFLHAFGTGSGLTWRITALWAPFLLSAAALPLFLFRKSRHGTDAGVRAFLLAYVFLKSTYTIVYVHPAFQGHWYFPLTIAVFNLVIITMIADAAHAVGARVTWLSDRNKLLHSIAACLAVLSCTAMQISFFMLKDTSDYNLEFYRLWNNRERVSREIRMVYQSGGIVEFDDGILSYALKVPAMSGFGPALDRKGVLELRNGRFLDLAWERGFRAVASVYYFCDMQPAAWNNQDSLNAYFQNTFCFLRRQNPDRWKFRMLYCDPSLPLLVAGFAPGFD